MSSSRPTSKLSVVSWNLLADVFSMTDRVQRPDERLCALLQWEKRSSAIKSQLIKFFTAPDVSNDKPSSATATTAADPLLVGADIICLQEVDMPKFESEWVPFFQSFGYAGELQQDKNRSEAHTVANATFFKTSRLTLTLSESRTRSLMTVFADRVSGKNIVVGNVHLQGNPYAPETRFAQMKSLLGRMASKCPSKPEDTLFVVAGDFNSCRNECVHVLLQSGSLKSDFVDRNAPEVVITKKDYAHPLPSMKCAFTPKDYVVDSQGSRDDELFTFAKPPMPNALIDFIFFSEKSMVLDGNYHPVREMQREELDVVMTHGLPTENHGSDHFPIAANFTIL